MQANPPAEADAALLEKLAAIHVGPGMTLTLPFWARTPPSAGRRCSGHARHAFR